MAAPAANPRRRSPQLSTSPKMLRKSDTFSARTGLRSELCSPLENSQYLLPRSPTTLDVLLNRPEDYVATQRAKLADFLKGIDDCMQDSSKDAGLDILNNQDVIVFPSLVTDQVIVPEPMALDEKKPEEIHSHRSDSALGTSIDTPLQDAHTIASTLNSVGTATTIHSAITRSFGADSTYLNNSGPELSKEALKQIQDKILSPILGEPSLKEFHPLVNQVPENVGSKHITNLRDIEKTFLYGSSRFSVSANSFKKFWDFTIQCLHTTVDFISERDQRKPSDRPYTNSYFLDLVEQIRRYAEIMRRTREKEENGEELDEMDFSPDEQIVVEGGLSHNGKLAELVRKKNGKSLSLIPEGSRPTDEVMSSKRALSDDEFEDDDDDVLRSMARRRKSDKAGDVMHVCSTCRKEFKRPCDLTKHEKTHSRPFKCCEKSCRYYELGWPTEKERDRHVNDKHSSAPKMYHCMFPPCPYSSKRESNCKQHMEKAHGWQYVRSKSNGRKKAGSTGPESAIQTPATPFTPLVATPASAVTSDSNVMQSPWFPTDNSVVYGDASNSAYGMANRRDSVTTAATNFTFSSGYSPDQLQATLDTAPPSENNYNFNSPPLFTNQPIDLEFDPNSGAVYQQPTPPLSTNDFNFDFTFATAGAENTTSIPQQQISPTGQGELSLFSPEMCLGDEGYGEGMDFGAQEFGGQDFVLFPPTSAATSSNTASNWFPEMDKVNFNPNQFDGFSFDAGNIFPQ